MNQENNGSKGVTSIQRGTVGLIVGTLIFFAIIIVIILVVTITVYKLRVWHRRKTTQNTSKSTVD